MPYISFKTNHKLTLRQENTIKSKSGELISLIPGKTEKALMIHMEDDQIMYFKGEEIPCMIGGLQSSQSSNINALESPAI